MVTHWVLVVVISTHTSRSSRSGCVRGTLSVFEAQGADGALALGFLFYVCVCLNLLILSHWVFLCLVSKVLSQWAELLPIGRQVSVPPRVWNHGLGTHWVSCHGHWEAPCVMCFKVNRGLAELPSLQWEAKWPLLDFTVLALYLKREEKKPGELKTRAGGDG